MNKFQLIIGDKHASSWSLRAWLMLKHCQVEFDECIIPLGTVNTTRQIKQFSAAGKVPVLKHGDLIIWESLAIGEYLAEIFPASGLWPENSMARAVARSVSNEMHAGFGSLRASMPFDLLARYDLPQSDELSREIIRLEEVWCSCREKFGDGGEYLFGQFGIADAMFAPVVLRFVTYGYVSANPIIKKYCDTIVNHQHVRLWINEA